MQVKFAKLRDDAKIPTKREEDAGYDIYACFDEECMVIPPHTCVFVPTGIASAFDNDYVALLRERGSTGSKQMALRCGVIDAGYRGEWKIAINNTSSHEIIIAKQSYADTHYEFMASLSASLLLMNPPVIYPYEKAIAQAILTNAYHADVVEITYEELENIKSERGTGMLGSSGA